MNAGTSLTPKAFTKQKLDSSSTIWLCEEFIKEREPCTQEEIIEAFNYTRGVENINNCLLRLERKGKITFNPRTKTFCIRRNN